MSQQQRDTRRGSSSSLSPQPSARQIAYRALALAPSPQLRYQRSGRYAEREGVVFVAYDVQDPTNHTAILLGPAPALARVLALAEEFFAGQAGGWSIMVDADARPPIEAELRARGWRAAEEEPGLVLQPIPSAPTTPPGLVIRRVSDEAALEDYYAAARAGFAEAEAATALSAAGEDLTRAFIPSLACALDRDIAIFVGYAGGEPVATAGLCRIEAIAVVMGVSVVPDWRRHGFGAAITWAAVSEGAARGCTAAALRATPMGLPVYERMGFRRVCRFRSYVAP